MKAVHCILVALLFVIPVPMLFSEGSDAASDDYESSLLIDFGNGRSEWLGQPSGATLLEAAEHVLSSSGIAYESDGTTLTTVNGIKSSEACAWRFYVWANYAWNYGDTYGGERYTHGTIAIGYYPDSSVTPLATPYYPEVWTQYRGDSTSSLQTSNTAPEEVAVPIEWYLEAGRGSIDTSLVFADGYLYFVAYGDQGKIGTRGNPCVCCVNVETHEIEWSQTYSSKEGYEILSPIIVGGMLLTATGDSHIFMFDRTNGDVLAELVPEGAKATLASSMDVTYYALESTVDSKGNSLLNGAEYKGVTNMAYDSGRLFFCTGDGQVHCFKIDESVGFTEVWRYLPGADERGSFYFDAPVVLDIGGIRAVMAGSRSGWVYCLNASDGSEIWTAYLGKLGDSKGSLSGITLCGDGTAVICVTDGQMSPLSGCMSLINLSDASVVWSLNIFGAVTVSDGVIYGYFSRSVYLESTVYDRFGNEETASAGFYAINGSTGRYIWKNVSNDKTTAGMIYNGGRLYSVDYSPGTDWPSGGAVRCLDAETGAFIWSVKLEPFAGTAYCMSALTIAGGKIYAANDAGIVYCLSETSSETHSSSSDMFYESQGLLHWSWLVLYALCAVVATGAIIAYKRF